LLGGFCCLRVLVIADFTDTGFCHSLASLAISLAFTDHQPVGKTSCLVRVG